VEEMVTLVVRTEMQHASIFDELDSHLCCKLKKCHSHLLPNGQAYSFRAFQANWPCLEPHTFQEQTM